MATKTSTPKDEHIEIVELKYAKMAAFIVSSTPLYLHRFSQKARQELLYPERKKNKAALERALKHDPLKEFRECCYRTADKDSPTLFHIPCGMLNRAMADAAIDLPGSVKKAKIQRMVQIVDLNIALFGIPCLDMKMVRSSDMNRTPDVRTRPLFNEWAAKVTLGFPVGILTQQDVGSLLQAAGMLIGLGDWRPQRGGSNGKFKVVNQNDEELLRIVGAQGRAAQLLAFENPSMADDETAELYDWFQEQLSLREQNVEAFIGEDEEREAAQ